MYIFKDQSILQPSLEVQQPTKSPSNSKN